jgi:WD40 repeat protein
MSSQGNIFLFPFYPFFLFALFLISTTFRLPSASDDTYIKIWDRRTINASNGKASGVLSGHTEGITYISPKGDGRYLVSNSKGIYSLLPKSKDIPFPSLIYFLFSNRPNNETLGHSKDGDFKSRTQTS